MTSSRTARGAMPLGKGDDVQLDRSEDDMTGEDLLPQIPSKIASTSGSKAPSHSMDIEAVK